MISLSRRKSVREVAERAYRQVVAQARSPQFFTDYAVPDTVDGRFELICLHAFLYLHRLKTEHPDAAAISQAFFDTMFVDMDRGLREMGTGDLSVGRHVKRMAQGFYGRIRAYQRGLAHDDATLGAALERNLFGTMSQSPPTVIAAMVEYTRSAAAQLAQLPAARLLDGDPTFPVPRIGESPLTAAEDAVR